MSSMVGVAEPRFADRRGRRVLSDAQLLLYFRARVKRLARSHAQACIHMPAIDAEDLQQNAYLAMLRLARRYDPALKIPFGAYLKARLRGSMLDTVRVEARQSKRDRLGVAAEEVEPTDERGLLSLLVAKDECPEQGAQRAKIIALLNRAARDCLTRRQRRALALLYYRGLTMKQAGALLGVGESRMSQIHATIMNHLRDHLQRQGFTAGKIRTGAHVR